jgi:hypothetical protein
VVVGKVWADAGRGLIGRPAGLPAYFTGKTFSEGRERRPLMKRLIASADPVYAGSTPLGLRGAPRDVPDVRVLTRANAGALRQLVSVPVA